jgi:FtsP/CotA-like multicopper oxidase with cupredoxin domain
MSRLVTSRREFVKLAVTATGVGLAGTSYGLGQPEVLISGESRPDESRVDYTLRIAASPIEIAPKQIVWTITYNGQFPGPLLRFKEGQHVTVDVHNDTDTPEQLSQRTWTAQRKKARLLYPRMGCAESYSRHARPVAFLSHAQSRGR